MEKFRRRKSPVKRSHPQFDGNDKPNHSEGTGHATSSIRPKCFFAVSVFAGLDRLECHIGGDRGNSQGLCGLQGAAVEANYRQNHAPKDSHGCSGGVPTADTAALDRADTAATKRYACALHFFGNLF
jgi:hypothetical protein